MKHEVYNFYCKRFCDGNPELHFLDEPFDACKKQCVECACIVGERRIKTKTLINH